MLKRKTLSLIYIQFSLSFLCVSWVWRLSKELRKIFTCSRKVNNLFCGLYNIQMKYLQKYFCLIFTKGNFFHESLDKKLHVALGNIPIDNFFVGRETKELNRKTTQKQLKIYYTYSMKLVEFRIQRYLQVPKISDTWRYLLRKVTSSWYP